MKVKTESLQVSSMIGNKKLLYYIYKKLKESYQEYTYSKYRSKYNIATSFYFAGDDILLEGAGQIILREKSHIARRSWLSAISGTTISIGNNTRIASNVTMITSNTQTKQDFSKSMHRSIGDINIGNYCWIGVNAYIKEGVTIGDNCIVGANSVVTKDIPSNSIVTGSNTIRNNFEKNKTI